MQGFFFYTLRNSLATPAGRVLLLSRRRSALSPGHAGSGKGLKGGYARGFQTGNDKKVSREPEMTTPRGGGALGSKDDDLGTALQAHFDPLLCAFLALCWLERSAIAPAKTRNVLLELVPRPGFEPGTFRLGGGRSIQLSYRGF